jgi:hypothetical protein
MSDRVNPGVGGLRGEFRPSYRPQKPAAPVLPDMRGIGLAALCGGTILAASVSVVMLFSHRHAGVPVIEAQAGPVRVKPADAGGMKLNDSDLAIGPAATQALAPPPEQPQIRELRAQLQAVKRQVARQAAESAKLAAQASKIMASPAPSQAAATLREPEVPPPQPGVRVQLAAFTDAAAAYGEWDALVTKMPDLLARRRPEISRVNAAGRTMWRLRTGPFASVADANEFCTKLRNHDTDCSIAAF